MKILIGIPTYDKKVDVEILRTIIQLPGHYPHIQFGFDFQVTSVITYSRNALCRTFLDAGYDYLYFWDADVVIKDLNFLEKLLDTSKRLNAQVVGGAYRLKHPHGFYAIANYKEQKETHDLPFLESYNLKREDLTKPMLVDCIATGSMLIKREVLETIPEPWFEIQDYPGARMWSEDFIFCDKARKHGFKVAVDPTFDTYHYGYASWAHLSEPVDSE